LKELGIRPAILSISSVGNRIGHLELSLVSGVDTSNVSRRYDAARLKLQTDRKLAFAKSRTEGLYLAKIAESQT